MQKLFLACLLSIVYTKAKCQLNPQPPVTSPNQYIEGARLVIDILQLFKKNNQTRASIQLKGKQPICNFCLYNSDSTQKIIVTLLSKEALMPDALTLVIQPKEKECSLQILCGIYNCKIETMDNRIISWGDIFINEKEFFISK